MPRRVFSIALLLALIFCLPWMSPLVCGQFIDVTAAQLPLDGAISGSSDWGDIDNDGDLDLIVTGWTESNATFVYTNDGGRLSEVALFAPVNYGDAGLADFDNDNDLDLVLLGLNDGPKSFFYCNEGGRMRSANAPLFEFYDCKVAWIDVDSDGDKDLFAGGTIGEHDQYCSMYTNETGRFALRSSNFGLDRLWGSCTGDIDADGDEDILLSGRFGGLNQTRVFENRWGSFVDMQVVLPSASGFSIADFDNDGDQDLVMTGVGLGPHNVAIYRNDAGTFVLHQGEGLALYDKRPLWVDIDNDGDLDLMLLNSGLELRNDGGTFVTLQLGLERRNQGMNACGDFDNDGDLDIYRSGMNLENIGEAQMLLNNGIQHNTAPSKVEGLNATMLGDSAILFQWSLGQDDETPSLGLTYRLGIGTQPGVEDVSTLMIDENSGRQLLSTAGALRTNHWVLRNIKPGTTYHARVMAIDQGFLAGPPSEEISISVPGTPPPVNDLSFVISPNPVHHELHLSLRTPTFLPVNYQLYSATGAKLPSYAGSIFCESSLDLSGLSHGVYYVRVSSEVINSEPRVLRVVKM